MDTLTIAEVKLLLEKIETDLTIKDSLNNIISDMSLMPMAIDADSTVKFVKFVRCEDTNSWEIVNRIEI